MALILQLMITALIGDVLIGLRLNFRSAIAIIVFFLVSATFSSGTICTSKCFPNLSCMPNALEML